MSTKLGEVQGMSGAVARGNKMDKNKERIEELKLRKADLKFKVIDTAGKLPDWWNEYEDWATRMIRSYYNY